MSVNIRKLNVGDRIKARFNGSSVLGNAPYVEDLHFAGFLSETRAELSYDSSLKDRFEIYFERNRWRYGSSAEVLTVQEVLR